MPGARCSAISTTFATRPKSPEAIESIKYGVRYIEKGGEVPVAEAGFQGTNRFSTANIPGNLQPGEMRVLGFVGPALPESGNATLVVPMIDVLGVRAPGGFALR